MPRRVLIPLLLVAMYALVGLAVHVNDVRRDWCEVEDQLTLSDFYAILWPIRVIAADTLCDYRQLGSPDN